IRECIAALNGNGPVDLMTLTHYQAARLFLASAKVKSIESGIDYSIEQIKNGKALERFRELIEWQGGDSNVIDDPDRLPVAEQIISIEAKQDGFLKSVHTTELGMLAVDLGAGRRVLTDQIRHGNGIEFFKKIGYSVSRGEEIARIHCDDSFDHKEIKKRFLALLEFDSQPVQADKLIRLYIDPQKTVHQITD
ncbi:MAG: hypothetical protein KDD94_07225, partial [Calditrichaeota bacterium]|nr:hypothetical protein [Calditrichota bacterium]